MPKITHQDKLQYNAVIIIACSFMLAIILRHAWLSDDAYITLRTVDNWVNGYGLVYNMGERVQSYTHPLWTFLLSVPYFFTHETFFTVITTSILLVISGLFLFATRIASSPTVSLIGILTLSLSKSFIDYTTSGLENPLTYFLLIVYLAIYFKGSLTNREHLWLSLICALGITNRLDLALLFLPPILYSLLTELKWRRIYLTVIGFTPIILWELFSLFYYGFLFPNTAYAKLNNGIPQSDIWRQGINYFINSLERDPITLTTITLAIGISILHRDWHKITCIVGILLYLIYIMRIGGDFMSGRFFSAPFLMAVLLLCHLDWTSVPIHIGMAIGILMVGIGLSSPYPTWLVRSSAIPSADITDVRGITDERAFYRENSLTQTRRIGSKILVADPLLARIPPRYNHKWGIGHFRREIPPGYVETIETKTNQIEDKDLAEFYNRLSIIIRDDLLNPARIQEIWRMNAGQYDHLINIDRYRYARAQIIPLREMANRPAEQDHWLAEGIIVVSDKSLLLTLETALSYATQLEISVASHNQYRVIYRNGDQELAEQEIIATHFPPAGLYTHLLHTPTKTQKLGFDSIRIVPLWAPKELDGISNAEELAGVDEVDIFTVGRVLLHDDE